ncbi:MAG TPA: SDR family oxidoreductase [Myxococcales bacterium]|nr:SDR family oxidoreductase [Myxococcales bacterium]
MKLAGKVALVTGGGRGIGKAIARAFAAEGAQLVLAARSEQQLESTAAELRRETGVRCLAHRCNVSDPGEVQRLVDAARAALGRIDVLVNSAGTYGPIGLLTDCDPDEWRRAIEVNLLGTVYASRAVLPLFHGLGGGRILNLAGAGIGGPSVTPRISAYAASKAAVVQFTESLAKEVAPWNVQVNAIAPGAVTTEITEAVIAAGPERAGREFYQRNVQQMEQGGDPPELAARLAVHLASDECKLTGKLLSAKWDRLDAIDESRVNRASLFALRRIDGVLFAEVGKP